MFFETFYFIFESFNWPVCHHARNWWLLYLQKERLLNFFQMCPNWSNYLFSVSGSNHSVTFIQIIIFQVHNNYQKELNYFELSQVTFYLNAGNHTSWYNSHKRQVGTIFSKDPHRCGPHKNDELSFITPPR